VDDFLDRMVLALNSHDPERFAAMFADDYRSAQPAHPGREFTGRPQVLENWTSVFEGVPDFSARLVSWARDGDTVWSEWDWRGHHTDGSPFALCGVVIMVLRDGLIAEGRLYVEAVDQQESSIRESVQELYRPGGSG
jgi:predicted SnoaL-like aldol condensation-catalyzing enzyme